MAGGGAEGEDISRWGGEGRGEGAEDDRGRDTVGHRAKMGAKVSTL